MNHSNKKNSFLISIGGIDGSGKSTQVNMLKKNIENRTNQDVLTYEAMKPEIYTDILTEVAEGFKKDMFSVFGDDIVNICYAAQLLRNLENVIIPAITNNITVITHRYAMCCEAYSMLSNCDMKIISKLLSLCQVPDFHFFLDISPEQAINRINKRILAINQRMDPVENIISLRKVNCNYHILIAEKYKNIIRIDTNGKNIELIADEIFNIIIQRTGI